MTATGNGEPDDSRAAARAMALSLSAWELAKSRVDRTESARSRLITLRAQQRLQEEVEQRLDVPPAERSLVLVNEGARDAVLLVHGATGTPADLQDLARFLHAAGCTVWAPLLPGHARVGPGLQEVMWLACLQEVRLRLRLLKRLFSRVHVVGAGFGAALALNLEREDAPASLVLLAPALVPRLPWPVRLLLRLGVHRLGWVQRRAGWNLQVLKAMEKARGRVGRLPAPVYAAQCADDERVSPSSLRLLQRKSRHRASRFRLYPSGGHAILAAHGQASLHVEILRFLKEV